MTLLTSPPLDALAPTAPLSRRQLADIAIGIGRSPLWPGVVIHDPAGRRPVRLLATDAYEVWVIGWLAEQRLSLHDHGDSAGFLTVVEGRLDEVEIDLETGERLTHPLGRGSIRWLPPGTVHGVANRASAPATSIHVYSPPLTSMTSYTDVGRPLDTTVVEQVPALLTGGGSVLRHPSLV
jgi:quercetin dioxygenase-like cupin family protein